MSVSFFLEKVSYGEETVPCRSQRIAGKVEVFQGLREMRVEEPTSMIDYATLVLKLQQLITVLDTEANKF